MSAYQYLQPTNRAFYVNKAVSTAITNVSTEQAFDQFLTFPSQSQRILTPPPILIRINTYGIMSTGVVNLGARLRVRWGGISGTVLLDTGALTLTASLANAGWECDATCLISNSNAAGQVEAQGYGSFATALSISALQMPNSAPISTDFSVANDIVITWQWTTAAVANSAQLRVGYAVIDGPNTQ